MKISNLLFFFCFLFSFKGVSEESYRFRVYLKDKGPGGFSIERPHEFLSSEAIERRVRFNIPITENDFPIAKVYFDKLLENKVVPVCWSRWHSTVVVECQDSSDIKVISNLAMVDSIQWVWKGDNSPNEQKNFEYESYSIESVLENYYGYAGKQIEMLNGIKLHESGFEGEGMKIAVIDAGFINVDKIAVFDSLQLLGTHNVQYPDQSVYDYDDHGTKVLSCLAANKKGVFVGTAPKASYWLIKSEDSSSEFPIEEDYWTSAVEFADSVGVDVISSSLGYFKYDFSERYYDQKDLNGKVAFISQTATMASSKGLLIFCSAGNEGSGDWGKITFPGDALNVITVGGVTDHKKRSAFSSIGFSADGRVKPDLVALGTDCQVISSKGELCKASGTSFATPILAGLGTCLWQAFPQLDNLSIIHLLLTSGNRYKKPSPEYGYGLPNIFKAYKRGLKDVRKSNRK